jgi:chemotaxis response regulator CheB
MATRDTIVIGASAGGVQPLSKLVADLPPDLPAAVFIVLHVSAAVPSLLLGILARESRLDVRMSEVFSGKHVDDLIKTLRTAVRKSQTLNTVRFWRASMENISTCSIRPHRRADQRHKRSECYSSVSL